MHTCAHTPQQVLLHYLDTQSTAWAASISGWYRAHSVVDAYKRLLSEWITVFLPIQPKGSGSILLTQQQSYFQAVCC